MSAGLALFDFDGTLSSRDTLLDFATFVHGKRAFYLGMLKLSPILALYKAGLYPNDKTKERFLSHFFGGMSHESFAKEAHSYATGRIDSILNSPIYEKFKAHKTRGDRVIVVSASAREWLEPWCAKESVELLCSELEVIDGRITGRLALPNCYGAEKARRIKAHLNIEEYADIYAYGNSRGDLEMLSLANRSLD